MNISIPKLSLVVLIGPSGSGKSTFARKHFLPTEVISSDYCRGIVSNDENDQSATKQAFELLHYIVELRLKRGLLTVIDATNVQKEARQPLIALARKFHCLPVAIVLNVRENICHERNQKRPNRDFGPHVVRNQKSQLRSSLRHLRREGFRHTFVMDSPEEIETAVIDRVPLWNDKRAEQGPFDIIGDVHGCAEELKTLLQQLGYESVSGEENPLWGSAVYRHPEGRKAVFVGDLVDRGPRVLETTRIVRNMVVHGSGHCVAGNHDVKLLRKLRGKNPQLTHGLQQTWAEIEALSDEIREPFCKELADFIDGLVSHYMLDQGNLVIAHAGLKEEMHGRGSGRVREFALYGETTGETDEFGVPVRYNWAADYRGKAAVVYGHTPVSEAQWLNNTLCIDTGCVFGGKLTAFRYPERECVSVAAKQTYYEPSRPFLETDVPQRTAQQELDDILDADDVIGKRIITTRLQHNLTIREENANAALEVMSRFAANPKWLIYLPPTMAPCETSSEDGLLEHPAEAFRYYQSQDVTRVICEEKHMGSRAVVVVCRDAKTAHQRFGVEQQEAGIVYTRTGRKLFHDDEMETELLDRLRNALDQSNFWDDLKTNWACFDCELMPWSAKAQELLRSQYAAVGAAGSSALPEVAKALSMAQERLADSETVAEVLQLFAEKQNNIDQFVTAYRQYCWPVSSIADYKLAPFHLLATEGKVHHDQNHQWHMDTIARFCQFDDQVFHATPYKIVELANEDSVQAATQWWTDLTANGGEGMVVKPMDWIQRTDKGLVQPAVKCRGKEYLRIIYSPDYDTPHNLLRLRKRSLGRKQSLALREFALGMESLEQFVNQQPLRRVHECVFGVLALESEPVDPRL